MIVVRGACRDSDTDYLFGDADRHDWIAAVTAWLCLDRPDHASDRLNDLAGRPKFRAVRHLIHHEPDHWLLRSEVAESLSLLLNGNYSRVWDATRKAVEAAAPGSAEALLSSNARRIYQLEAPAHEA